MGEDPEQLSQGTQKKLAADLPLLPEGYVVAAREARIHQRGRWYVVELAKAEGLPNAPPLRVLPNQRLAMLEAILSRPDAPPVFVVTGRVTEFLGANYLLLENLEELSSRSAGPPGRPESAPETGAATRPAAATAEPTAEEIMQRLLDHKTLRPVVLPDRAPTADDGAGLAVEDDPSVAAAAKQGITWPEEALLVDRIGRVVPGKLWWMFVFEDQGRHPMHKPIRLLPNQLLETAVALSRGGTQGMVFVTSGEVTLHRGMNYLLLRKVLVRRDLGNFR